MSFGDYLIGSIELLAVAAAIGFGAVRLRARLLGGWSGASARLAEVVLGISLLVVILELVGVVGLYRPGWVLAACLIAGPVVGVVAGGRPGQGPALPALPVKPVAMALATAAALLVTFHWTMPTQVGLDIGMYLPNTTWQNAPFAARFVQDAQVGAIHQLEVLRLMDWFYPQNSELLHSAGILFLGNDFLSPLINIGWMALCLLVAWSFGRPYGAGPTAVLALGLVVGADMLLLFQPGDAKNDTMGLFFFLAAAAILVNAEAQRRSGRGQAGQEPDEDDGGRGPLRLLSRWPGTVEFPTAALVIAGLAAGMALGTKLNFLAPVLALSVGVIAVSAAGTRLRTTGIWVVSALATGGFWFVRNLIEAGNPVPWFNKGPLPGPDQLDIDIREPHNVADYITNSHVITGSLFPGLHDSFGLLWPLVLAVLAAGIVLALLRGATPVMRMLGAVAAFSAVAYLFTPLTAAGPLDHPTAFTTNLRYASPALGLGAMLLAVYPRFREGRAGDYLRWGLAALLVVQAVPIWDIGDDVWRFKYALGGIALTVLIVLVPVGLTLLGQRGAKPATLALGAALAIGIAIGIGWPRSDDYIDGRYQADTAPSDFPTGVRSALAWFNEADPTDSSFAVVGGRAGFKQYVFYGNDLSNRVQYVAHHGKHGAYTPITSCREWRQAINDGGYDYVVITPDQRTQGRSPVEAVWTGTDPAATKLLEDDLTFVFKLDGDLDPSACGAGARPEAVAG
ncbi:MAG: hypothetical protein EXQ70_08625 [Solirubrobacterales bacterium]|nr:hypothetical protein [Solirubrobacterales bacterium]